MRSGAQRQNDFPRSQSNEWHSQDSTPSPLILLTSENISPVPSVVKLLQHYFLLTLSNNVHQHLFLKCFKYKKNLPPKNVFPNMPLSRFAWLNLVNVTHSFLPPKSTRRQVLETKCTFVLKELTRVYEHRVPPWATDC